MPLSLLQSTIIRLISTRRDPESYIAGGTCLTRETSRVATDIVIYHEQELSVAQAAASDLQVLEAAGMIVTYEHREVARHRVLISYVDQSTRVEWVAHRGCRFSRSKRIRTLAMSCLRLMWRSTRLSLLPKDANRATLSTSSPFTTRFCRSGRSHWPRQRKRLNSLPEA